MATKILNSFKMLVKPCFECYVAMAVGLKSILQIINVIIVFK